MTVMTRITTWVAAFMLFGFSSVWAESITRGGTFVYAVRGDVLFLDPVWIETNPGIWTSMNIYDTLIKPSKDGKTLEPGLAESWDLAKDARSVTLTLRPGIKFADGSPIKVSDVKFSLDRARGAGEFSFLLESVKSVETIGTDKVVVRLKQPDPAILSTLATFHSGIVSEKLLRAAPGENLEDKAKAFAEKPMGSGPFILKSWRRGSEMVLARNPHYWKDGKDGKKLPYVDEVKLMVIPDDATRMLKLQAGEVDGAEFVPFSRVAEFEADPEINMRLIPAAKVIYIAMNNRPKLKDGTKNPLGDKRVRQALNYAVDKVAIAKVLTYDVGKPNTTYMPPSTPYALVDTGTPYPYNPGKAKKLLADAGYGNGFDLNVQSIAGNSDDATYLAVIQQMWKAVGANLEIEPLELTTRHDTFYSDNYQLRTGLWTNDINDPSQITQWFAYFPTFASNRSGFRDMKLEELYLKSQSEINPKNRAEQYRKIQEIFIEAAPQIFLLEVPYAVALRKYVKDFVQIPLGCYIYAEVHKEK